MSFLKKAWSVPTRRVVTYPSGSATRRFIFLYLEEKPMRSITNAVSVAYGFNDEPEPLFNCPVVLDPKVLKILNGTPNKVETIVRSAACAVELVGRFEGRSRYVDFASRLALAVGELPISLRVQLVRGNIGNVARIDFSDADQQPAG